MKLRANKKNLKEYSRDLLGNNYSEEKKKELIDICVNQSPEFKRGEHPSFAIAVYVQRIDEVLGNFGVEWLSPELDLYYSNTGETYAPTIYWLNGKLWIGDWGSMMEKLK